MYELVQVGPQSYYINSPAKIGIYAKSDSEVYLIDSGNDKEAAKKILKIAAEKNWVIEGILNTHSNADHIGGNAFIQNKNGCKSLRNKFLMAKESDVTDFNSPNFPKEVEIIPLPGHFFDMVGFRTPDNTVFLADCVSSPATLDKYGVTFIYDVAAYLETLAKIQTIKAEIFIPSHADPCKEISDLAVINRNKVFEIEKIIVELCSKPITIDEVISGVFRHYGLTMSIEQYVLVGSTIRSYLSWMKDRDILEYLTDEANLLWKKKEL